MKGGGRVAGRWTRRLRSANDNQPGKGVASSVLSDRRRTMPRDDDRAPSRLERTDGNEVAEGANADATGERIFLDESWSISDREDGGHVAVKHDRETD